ncbi:hypothetical protein [Rhodococcus sp. USK13]|uniref:hypothetical protein n=1 Tax=Rhodococcus sp. USK13 TaxID=2806442 RepID=UPI002016E958|nr:hypothetical protein [Rhodococcus sp. USK13]
MTRLTATDSQGHEWELMPTKDGVGARLIADGDQTAILQAEQLLAEHGPLLISACRPAFSMGTHEALADVVNLVASDPETASLEQVREVAAVAQLLLARSGVSRRAHLLQGPTAPFPLQQQATGDRRSGLAGGPW